MARFCTKCGAKLGAHERFCTTCGAPADMDARMGAQSEVPMSARPIGNHARPAPRPLPRACAVCGAPLADGVSFCTACGAPASRGVGAAHGTDGVHVAAASQAGSGYTVRHAQVSTGQASASPREASRAARRMPGQAVSEAPAPSGRRMAAAPAGFDAASSPAAEQATRRSPKRSHRSPRRVVLIVVVTLLVLLAVGGGVFVALGGPAMLLGSASSKTDGEAYYLSEKAVDVTADTRIMPSYGEDDLLSSYTVRVKQADDADGVAQDISAYPGVSVSGAEGFKLSDIGELPDGTYLLCVEDDSGKRFDLPPLVLGGDGGAALSSLTVVPPEGSAPDDEFARDGKYRVFLDKLNELIANRGDASLTVMKVDEEKYVAWAAGVAYAGLVDFGDGMERLVVAYCTDKDFATSDTVEGDVDTDVASLGPDDSDYAVEVWEYDNGQDAVNLVYTGVPLSGDDGMPYVSLVENPSSGHVCLAVRGEDVNGSEASVCFGLTEDVSIGVLDASESEIAAWQASGRYMLKNAGLSQEAALGYAEAGASSCEKTAQTAKDLVARLETIAGSEGK